VFLKPCRDTETIGCDPSLSSIPVGEQRSLDSALQEVADWMAAPGNEAEFVTLFFDDQSDLGDWVGALTSFQAALDRLMCPGLSIAVCQGLHRAPL